MKNLRYDVISADLDYGVKMHPQTDMLRLGYNLIKSEPVMIADCWWFRVSNQISNPPPYIDELPDDFKFSDEKRKIEHDKTNLS